MDYQQCINIPTVPELTEHPGTFYPFCEGFERAAIYLGIDLNFHYKQELEYLENEREALYDADADEVFNENQTKVYSTGSEHKESTIEQSESRKDPLHTPDAIPNILKDIENEPTEVPTKLRPQHQTTSRISYEMVELSYLGCKYRNRPNLKNLNKTVIINRYDEAIREIKDRLANGHAKLIGILMTVCSRSVQSRFKEEFFSQSVFLIYQSMKQNMLKKQDTHLYNYFTELLSNCKQNIRSITEYTNQLESFFEALTQQGRNFTDADKLFHLTTGLHGLYAFIVQQIRFDKFITYSEAKNLLIDQENDIRINSATKIIKDTTGYYEMRSHLNGKKYQQHQQVAKKTNVALNTQHNATTPTVPVTQNPIVQSSSSHFVKFIKVSPDYECQRCHRVGRHDTSQCNTKGCRHCNSLDHKSHECPTLKSNKANLCKIASHSPSSIPNGNKQTFIIDSGANKHTTNSAANMLSCMPTNEVIQTANGNIVPVLGKGDLKTIPGEALLAPDIKENLISISQLDKEGYISVFYDGTFLAINDEDVKQNLKQAIQDSDSIILQARINDEGLYETFDRLVDITDSSTTLNTINYTLYPRIQVDSKSNLVKYIHEAYGHLSEEEMIHMVEEKTVENLPDQLTKAVIKANYPNCEACIKGSLSKFPLPKIDHKDDNCINIGDVVSVDLWGPANIPSVYGSLYFMLGVDKISRYMTIRILKTKQETEVLENLQSIILEYSKYSQTIKKFRFDIGLKSIYIETFLQSQQYEYEFSCPHDHGQNGQVERHIRTVSEKIISSIRTFPNTKWNMWEFAAIDVVTKLNLRIAMNKPCSIYEYFTRKKVNSKDVLILPFGLPVMAFVPTQIRKGKLSDHAIRGIVVGTLLNFKHTTLIYNPTTRKLIRRRTFVPISEPIDHLEIELGENEVLSSNILNDDNDDILHTDTTSSLDMSHHTPTTDDLYSPDVELTYFDDDEEDNHIEEITDTISNNHQIHVNRYGRPIKPRSVLTYHIKSVDPSQITPKSLSHMLTLPDSAEWIEAYDAEMKVFDDRNVLIPVATVPKNAIILDMKFVFKRVYNTDATLKKRKVRLVLRGDRQKPDSYDETYAPNVDLSSIFTLLFLVQSKGYFIQSIDIRAAFLYPDIKENIYVRIPTANAGSTIDKYKYAKLNKAVYGLKQAAHEFNQHQKSVFLKLGFTVNSKDPCIYYKYVNDNFILLCSHVDDVMIISDNPTLIENTKSDLMSVYEISINDTFSEYLGMRIERDETKMTITQPKNLEKIISLFRQDDILNLKSDTKIKKYLQSLFGNLLYISRFTRPDILYKVHFISTKLQHPTLDDVKYALDIVDYLKSTVDYKLVFYSSSDKTKNINVVGFADASYADNDDFKSTYGYTIKLDQKSSPVYSVTKKTKTIVLSTTEAEIYCLIECLKQMLWIAEMLQDINFQVNFPLQVMQDNMSAIKIAKSPSAAAKRAKYFIVKIAYVQELINNGRIKVDYLDTNNMLADLLTKDLSRTKMANLSTQLFGHITA